jgi:hypothetical protein
VASVSAAEAPRPELAPAGTVLELAASQWAYGDGPLRLRVVRDRADLSRYYANQRWIEGWRLDDAGAPVEWIQALVPVEVLTNQVTGGA